MPVVNFSPVGNDAPFLDSSGNPLSGGLLYTYTAGSSTPETTYTTSAGSVSNANPIVLNSGGYPASAGNVVSIWLTQGTSYKFVLKTSAAVEVWSRDNIYGINDPTNFSAAGDQWVASGHTPTYISATSFSVTGDQTATYQANRRIKTTNTGGTIYSRIKSSAFGSVTTVTVVNDSGTLDSGLSAVSLGVVTPINGSVPVLIDTYPVVSGSSDKTKLIRIEADGLTTDTTRVITPIDADILIGDSTSGLLQNVGLAVTMAANAVTVALKGADGNDPSAGNVVGIGFRSATQTSGASSFVRVTAATSVVISSGSTLGTVSAQASRIWVLAINNAGTVELVVTNRLTATGLRVSAIKPNTGTNYAVIDTTAEGGAGGADSAAVYYSTTARTAVPFVILGCFDSTQTTAGTWAASPNAIHVNPPFRPGQVIFEQWTLDGAVATGTTVTPDDDTIPQVSEGDQYLSVATVDATGFQAPCVTEIEASAIAASSAAGNTLTMAVFNTTSGAVDALAAVQGRSTAAGLPAHLFIKYRQVINSTASINFAFRIGGGAAGTTTFNGTAGVRKLGGVMGSYTAQRTICV